MPSILFFLKMSDKISLKKFLPAQRRPIILVPPREVLTTGMTSANSDSKALQGADITLIH